MSECRHYWRLVGEKGSRWHHGHALARCSHCPAWTVVEYSEGKPGPCPHVKARLELQAPGDLLRAYKEATNENDPS